MEISIRFGLPFLPTFAWVGLWTSLIVLLIALFDLSAFIRYFTRFTDETFAFLISVIFIYEAVRNLSRLWNADEIDHHTALSSWVLAAGTFIVATQLRDIRKSSYLRPAIREFLADFGSVIAIASMVVAATFLPYADLPTLEIPDTVATTSGRPWLVDLWAMPTWGIFAAIIPAAFCSVLIYLDQHITARLVNRSENRLKKGPGYHLDLTVTALLMAVNSLFGIPWLVAATVRSLNHILALATVEESVDRSGAVRENIVHVRENRLSGIAIHLLLGMSVFILPQLKRVGIEIPMSVILGLFLFMGVTSLTGNQFWDRLKLWAMEPSQYPSTHYVRRVPIHKVHLYTAIQLVCFGAL
ncbi:MAG: HCO3- transporter, partial [Myxococcota bacterium]